MLADLLSCGKRTQCKTYTVTYLYYTIPVVYVRIITLITSSLGTHNWSGQSERCIYDILGSHGGDCGGWLTVFWDVMTFSLVDRSNVSEEHSGLHLKIFCCWYVRHFLAPPSAPVLLPPQQFRDSFFNNACSCETSIVICDTACCLDLRDG
jgi:hypothetical protein